MKYIYSIIKADYLQRTRSYAFLIALAIGFYAAYSFVPPPAASYTTLNIPGFRGVYNSAYVGHVSAMMTTIMLSLYGFFLVHGGIKKDIDTAVGLIIATTPITNFEYLLSKMLSNLLVLLTITGCAFMVSIVLFFIRTDGSPFIPGHFIIPFLLFVVPAMFLIAALAIVIEVIVVRRPILQYIAFFFLFGVLMSNASTQKNDTLGIMTDPFGIRILTNSIKALVNTQFHEHIENVSLGFISGKKATVIKVFEWNGVTVTRLFLLSRGMWIMIAIALTYCSSFLFHRFDFRPLISKQKKATGDEPVSAPLGIDMALLPPLVSDYGILPFIKTELLLLIRKGSKWYWLVIIGLSASMLFAPVNISHLYLLPVLWFLQVTRWSDLATKEEANGIHYFTYASYKPLQRMLPAQILAGIILAVVLALPLIVRYLLALNLPAVIDIINGAICIVLLAVCLGIVSKGKKLFEILFFLITYILIQHVPLVDYLGALNHDHHALYIAIIAALNIFLLTVSLSVRKYQLRHL